MGENMHGLLLLHNSFIWYWCSPVLMLTGVISGVVFVNLCAYVRMCGGVSLLHKMFPFVVIAACCVNHL